jgi:hypothetical protein
MSALSYSEQVILLFSILGGVFSVGALSFVWWISRPARDNDEDAHRTAAE